MKKAPLLISVFAFTVACTSIECPLHHTVSSHYVLLKSDQAADTLKDTLSISIVRQYSVRPDTLLLNKAIGVTKFELPVSHTNAEDTLYFKFSNLSYAATDTVWLKKENIPHFESVDCSASFLHILTAVNSTHHAIDSIKINNPSVDYDPQTVHFHLYLKSRR